MLTILCWPHPNAWRILWCLRSQFISAGRDPKNSTACLNSGKPNSMPQRSNTQPHLQWSNTQLPSSTVENSTTASNGRISTDVFSKSSNSQDHLFWTWRHPHYSPISCLGVYHDKWWLSYPLHTNIKLNQLTMHLD